MRQNRRLGKERCRGVFCVVAIALSVNKGFSAQNIWRMKQFYETYYDNEKLPPLVREIPWSNNLLIMSYAV